jgi:hypothetical protein
MIYLDVPHVFDTVGGPGKLIDLLSKHCPGHDLRYPAVQMWHQRAAIPAKWIVPVLYALHREHRAWTEFCADDAEFEAPRRAGSRR